MTNSLGQTRRATGMQLPTQPTGWPIGSYPTYVEAQRSVDYLSDKQFPVQNVTIVGADLIQVERVVGRLDWQKVILGGVVSGAWLGIFVGLVLSIFTGGLLAPLATCVVMGMVFGVVSTSILFAATKGQRDFSSTTQLVAGRYDVLCEPTTAERAKGMLATLALS